MDDYAMIVENRAINDLEFLQLDFSNAGTAAQDHLYYRPVTHLLNFFSRTVAGDNPLYYHWISLILFYISGISLYELVNILWKNRRMAWIASGLFCAHPINGILVNYINASGYSVLIFSLNFSLINYLTGEERKNANTFRFFSLLWFIVALLCHEVAAAYPFYLAALLLFIKKYNFKRIFFACLPSIIVLVVYFIFRLNYASLKSGVIDHIAGFQISLSAYAATFAQLILFYLSNLVLLRDIVLMKSFPVIKENLFLWNVGLIAAASLLFWLLRFGWKKDKKSFSLAWIAIGLLPVSLAVFSRPWLGLIFEPHWVLYSTIGFFILLAFCFEYLKGKISATLWWVILITFFVTYIFSARLYNTIWADEKRYCRYMLDSSPGLLMAEWWLAESYRREDNYQGARHHYDNILSQRPGDWHTYVNLGTMELKRQDNEAAMHYFRKAFALNSRSAALYNNIGCVYKARGDIKSAERFFKAALKLDAHYLEAQKNLANLYRK